MNGQNARKSPICLTLGGLCPLEARFKLLSVAPATALTECLAKLRSRSLKQSQNVILLVEDNGALG